jgi:hypothetical protein
MNKNSIEKVKKLNKMPIWRSLSEFDGILGGVLRRIVTPVATRLALLSSQHPLFKASVELLDFLVVS